VNGIKKTIYICGSSGMVGSSLIQHFKSKTSHTVISTNRGELDLMEKQSVDSYFKNNSIDYMIIAAAKVGGIFANDTYPKDFIYNNLVIQNNLINAAHEHNLEKVVFLGSSCIYPKLSEQPIKEEYLLTGSLEPTNEPYAIAKIAGIKLCESFNRQYGTDFRCLMPTNLYGPRDNFDYENSHVIPALLRKFYDAIDEKKDFVEVWGTGKPMREFLHVDDLCSACEFILNLEREKFNQSISDRCSHLNVGYGEDISIKELAEKIKDVVKFKGDIKFDDSKKDGTYQKLLDSKKINSLGWKPKININDGLESTYDWFIKNKDSFRGNRNH
jgi:GDP-L-fucose synthase